MYHNIICECGTPSGPLRSPSVNTSKTNDEICFAHFFYLMSPSHSFRDISDSKILKTLRSKALRRAQPSTQFNSPSGHCLRAPHCVQQNKQKIKALKAKAPQCLRPSKLQNDPLRVNLTSASLRSETKVLKAKVLKGAKPKSTSVPSDTKVLILSGTSTQRALHIQRDSVPTSASSQRVLRNSPR